MLPVNGFGYEPDLRRLALGFICRWLNPSRDVMLKQGKRSFSVASLIETHIKAVDSATLTPIVLQALNCTDGKLVEWTCEPLQACAASDKSRVRRKRRGRRWTRSMAGSAKGLTRST